jgi:hypothetical protein
LSDHETRLGQDVITSSSYFAFGLMEGSDASIAAFAALTLFAGIGFGFHHQRRAELRTKAGFSESAAARVDRAYDAAACFAMIVLIFLGGLIADLAAYTFFAPPQNGDVVRDISGGQALANGALVVAAWLIFRARFWSIRGGRPDLAGPRGCSVNQAAASDHGTAWSTSTVQW